jgi:hypothetical protein
LGPGQNLSAPFVGREELDRIRGEFGIRTSQKWGYFGVVEDGKIEIRTNPCGSCVFHQDSRCQIYNARPFDCKIFPLDIIRIGFRFYWIGYSDFCEQTIDWEALLEFGEQLLATYGQRFVQEFAQDANRSPIKHTYYIFKEIK